MVTLARDLYVLTSSGPTNIPAIFVFALHIAQAVFVDWDIKQGQMTVHRWSPANGYAVASRLYP